MSEIAKCPCCGGELVMDEEGDAHHCCECFFACEPKYIHRIAAAMELARLIVERQKVNEEQMFTGPITEETVEKFRVLNRKSEEALWRVLEVFK